MSLNKDEGFVNARFCLAIVFPLLRCQRGSGPELGHLTVNPFPVKSSYSPSQVSRPPTQGILTLTPAKIILA
ncbi:MAG: hypothetical protein ACHQ1H_10620, partial [Nitrososphaerales archaeon]